MSDLPPLQTPPPVSVPKNSALAIWSLVLGIVAVLFTLFCLGPLFAIPAVICGHMAMSRIKHSLGLQTGNGMAIGGLVTGYLSIALSVFMIPMMMAIAIPNFVKARQVAMKNVCINNLRQIDAAVQQWALDKGKQPNDTPTWSDLEPYLSQNMKTVPPICVAGGTYTLNAVSEHPTCSIPGHTLSP